jgi:hypothetical protein
MKKQNTLLAIGILLLSTVILFSSCSKKSDDPAPTPSPPTFLMSSVPDPGDPNAVIFQFKCTTNDVRLTKVVINDPLGLINDTYDLQQMTVIQNTVYFFNFSYTKASGKWTFAFTGNRSSDNTGFVSTTYLTMSK